VRGSRADVSRSHPRLGGAAVQGVAVHWHVGGEDETVGVVGGHSHLALRERNGTCAGDHVHFLPVGDGLQALQRPDRQALVSVDAARDVGKGECCHWLRR